MSWFSSPENQFGAMGSTSRRFSFGNRATRTAATTTRASDDPGRRRSREPPGGPHPDLEHQERHARWFGPAGPLVDSDLHPVGTDRLSGTITNRLDIPLEDAIVAFGKQVYLVGTIGPHATITRRAIAATATSRATSRRSRKVTWIGWETIPASGSTGPP